MDNVKPEQLPDEAVTAAAIARYYHAHDPDDPPIPWDLRTPRIRSLLLAEERAAIAAALNAWPDMQEIQCNGSYIDEDGDVTETTAIVLPLGENNV